MSFACFSRGGTLKATELCLTWASKCHYCQRLLLKTRGVRVLFSESSDFAGVSGLLKGDQAYVDVSDGCRLGTDDIHMGQGLLPWLFSHPWPYASSVPLTLYPDFSSEKAISDLGYYSCCLEKK